MRVSGLFSPGHTLVWEQLIKLEWPWEAIALISSYVKEIGAMLDSYEYDKYDSNVWIHKTAKIAPSAFLGENIIIGADTEIRHCAFIRKDAIVGKGAVVGNSTELKNVILFDSVQVPHYNYVGDSVLGYKSHLGAGAITSNVKSDSSLISVACGDKRIETGLKKFGAILGDFVEVGCNSVLNPGTVVGTKSNIYPLSMVRGFVPANSIYKKQGEITEKR
ncbi:MAG: UDP-N-acetylglucosamine pyrophosphorylase [Oscillospiraceae bacterium]|nr:UDP-N-acetylglucosamine pyrophosphorylase [Oscillospiraceae bacterium]